MRPDQHPDLVSMGVGKITCDKCMLNLFQGEPDETCEDCKLNILIHGTPSEKQAHIRALVDEINSADTQAVIKSYIDLIPTKQQRS
ncbi:hypothetical protein A2533_02405 [Candidatus Falkowbacteria bacterium RIFOXYD2_FULL_35_9]|uniref:Uncharacterized protein n=1 Tax=Candidatus Falkowbacteria bacterium RIFOXYC2_FULL_36_12 TaxID=1798002 RepID=A0A1F5SW90_9BACT|nr:MAG: hypothetical protein A2478_00980 [Candidatus Falkowbacteria bacterium RIFOXYC2_FULL_36_12]OGF31300.1 MAG: hypothetical protein A2300_00770 [Candidatus Falkowbacteria bacterium RIFOXYB2_FULL_35_7]OGF34426.1 MAG: hypothetical protein A2223_02780 [Candidatus Falkowbacteria bacterium RIFOXYA2_FULL_35_8]OGF45648.1 MAG: hypothetical protein A2533_02405 [Candidatus Falkowbacteria bacterium RIFOXYD2_FULL_35_9]